MSTKYQDNVNERRALNALITLKRANNTISTILNRHITEHQLTVGQFGILEALLHLGPLSQQTLSQKILSSKGNITMIIDNLEKQSLVKRTTDPNDRRVAMIQLTPTGKAFINKIMPEHIKKIITMMSVLTADEMKELSRLCKKVGLSIKQEKQR